jgi:hypothetical protein
VNPDSPGRFNLSQALEFIKKPGAGEANRTPDPNLGNASASVSQFLTKFRQVSNSLTINEIIEPFHFTGPYRLLSRALIIALLKLRRQFNNGQTTRGA